MEDNFDNFDFSSLAFDTPATPSPAPAQPAVAQPVASQETIAPVDLDKAAAEAENFTLGEIALGSSVSTSIVEPYKPVAGVLSRIAFISDRPQPLKTHYLAKDVPSLGKRSILCRECSCCTLGNPSVYYLFPIIEYPSILGSKPLQPDTTRQPVLKVLKCGKKLYDAIVNLYEQTGSILGMDFGLTNTSQGEWVQTSIMAIPGNWQQQFPGSLETLSNKWDSVKSKAWTAFAAYKSVEEIDQAIRQNNYTPPAQPDFNSEMLGF